MDIFAQIAEKIIKEQEGIIGPLAVEQASKVNGLTVDWSKHEVALRGNQKDILDNLVKQYEHLFGPASVEVCKDAVRNLAAKAPKEKLPSSLQ